MSTPNSRHEGKGALILGARSWIGYHLGRQLESVGWQVKGTSSRARTTEANEFYQLDSVGGVTALLDQLQPQIIVNLLIGTTEKEYAIHKNALRHVQDDNSYYVYASSALALDGYTTEPLVESLAPRSVSEYGQFKGRCEQLITESRDADCLILRFSSIHGWSPYKASRTVNLLEKVRHGETVQVDTGVLQNRLTDQMLSETIVSLVSRRAVGVAHIGTDDSSEEVDFLRRLAELFGYSPEHIIERKPRPVNLAVIPELGRHPDGAIYEADTLNQLLKNPALQMYKAGV